MAANSQREYHFMFLDLLPNSNELFLERVITIDYLFSKDSDGDVEYKYALQDEIDKVLDLKVGESMYISAIRDNPEQTKGILIRTQ